jgi:hypothetical protein
MIRKAFACARAEKSDDIAPPTIINAISNWTNRPQYPYVADRNAARAAGKVDI